MHFKIYRTICIALMCCVFTALSAIAGHPLKIAGADKTDVGIYIEDLKTGNVIADVNSTSLYIPASITKSFTSASAILTFNPDGSFSTPVYARGEIKDGVLNGNIVICTIGDPTIESAHFKNNLGFADSIATAVSRCGIKLIKGTVVLDESKFIDDTTPKGWQGGDLSWGYGTGVHATNYRDNIFTLTLPSMATSPKIPDGCIKRAALNGSFGISRKRGDKFITLSGAIPKKEQAYKLAMPDPSALMIAEVKKALEEKGIAVNGENITPKEGKSVKLYNHTSPRLDQILKSLMTRSDNMMAEGILRALADGKTREEALEYEKSLWTQRGVNFEGIQVYDGSGLSRDNRFSPRFLASVLKVMYKDRARITYSDLFPRVGEEGTVRGFLKDTRLQGRLALKTGSMSGVQSYAGYLTDDRGVPTHAVVLIVNNFTCPRDNLKKAIADYLLGILP